MKKITFILFTLIAGTAFAQNTAVEKSAIASADIVTPVTLTHVRDLSFGKVIADATNTEILVLNADDGGTVNASTTATYITTSTRTSGKFQITANAGRNFSVTMPTQVILSGDLIVTLSKNLADTGNTATTGDNTLIIGGSLSIPPQFADGLYSKTFNVSVDYE